MTDASEDRHDRRTFLKQMATVAGTAPLAGALLGASASSAQTEATAPKQATAHETERLAAYAAGIRYEDLPPEVVQRAKDCIIDAVATISFGAELPWSKMILAYAQAYGSGGEAKSSILGTGGRKLNAPAAAFVNGAFGHAFELDATTEPNSGTHPSATLFTSALAVGQERGLTGRDLVTAFVAGGEAMYRIGYATKHSNETRGFHAPGTTGPFGAAVAVGRMREFDAAKMTNALGIAGSLACGLLEFVSAGNGAMVKRLHLGRAAESGVLAATLASEGFTGPTTVLEGEFGFLRVYCNEWDLAQLTRGFGSEYFTKNITMKRYACHMTAQNPVEATEDLRNQHKFSAADIASMVIAGDDRVATRNNILAPEDKMMAQYSVPFSVALSLYRDARDPRSFNDDAVIHDSAILDLASRIKSVRATNQSRQDTTATVTIKLKDGRELSQKVSYFKGTAERPLDQAELKEKFMLMTANRDRARMETMFARLQHLETEKTLDWIEV
ncbi:MAG TPA: MmgE/PrpD family protein [Xanthobacteraceae bacterium]|nr:MmgE/PrpD family protein [Xanthobacteraceae bacterium]